MIIFNKLAEIALPSSFQAGTLGLIIALTVFSCGSSYGRSSDLTPSQVVPSKELLSYQQMELVGFIHFTINTFTDKEWGFGDEQPELFDPSQLDVEQWVQTAKSAGMKELILTAKHHDGFCLWPSEYTEHSIKHSPYKDGKGDIVREFVNACRKYSIKPGLYLSPWDRNHPEYGRQEYLTYYRNQLKELLSEYGEINEIWFDGANGGDGYYGGANETRRIESEKYYHWDDIFSFVRSLQPGIKIFSDAGPDIHWIGNEWGSAGTTFWSTIDPDSIVIGKANTKYLNSGDPLGREWVVGQCDVSIRPGWFYHQKEDDKVKSPWELMDIYFNSVGRNAVLLLNLPPDQRGIINENDITALQGFRKLLDETFAEDLIQGAAVTASNFRNDLIKFAPENVLQDNNRFWATDDSCSSAYLTVTLPQVRGFDTVLLQEPVEYGQRISQFEIEIMDNDQWKSVFQGTTIGYKRLIRLDTVNTNQLRVRLLKANNTPALSKIGLYKLPEK